jgi:hypothetical protein
MPKPSRHWSDNLATSSAAEGTYGAGALAFLHLTARQVDSDLALHQWWMVSVAETHVYEVLFPTHWAEGSVLCTHKAVGYSVCVVVNSGRCSLNAQLYLVGRGNRWTATGGFS